MDWGLQNRISRIIKPTDNRALMLAVDHGYFLGPTEKLEIPKKTIAPILKYCDSIMVLDICDQVETQFQYILFFPIRIIQIITHITIKTQ